MYNCIYTWHHGTNVARPLASGLKRSRPFSDASALPPPSGVPAKSPPIPYCNDDSTAAGDAGYTVYTLAAGLTVETDTPL